MARLAPLLLRRLLFNQARTFAPSSAIRSFKAKTLAPSSSSSSSAAVRSFNASDYDEKKTQMNDYDEKHEVLFFSNGSFLATRTFCCGNTREDADRLSICMGLPGLSKDHFKVTLEENGKKLVVLAEEQEKEDKPMEKRRRYTAILDVSHNIYKVDEIKAKMMPNGMLIVTVPKLKEEKKKAKAKEVFVVHQND